VSAHRALGDAARRGDPRSLISPFAPVPIFLRGAAFTAASVGREGEQTFDGGAVVHVRYGSCDGVMLGGELVLGGGRDLDADQLGGAGA
jgi:hypothetical protein